MDHDERYMRTALKLARMGVGRASPNPAVGCVIVKGGKIVGSGHHKKAGEPHAEIHALRDAGPKAKGATMYVTLEPCCCQGRTPPCTKDIIKAGISKVVAAMLDPNPKVSGKGIKSLEKAGIKTRVGVMEEDARKMNEAFGKHITTKSPFVIVKAALSADGKMSASDGSSRWITCDESRMSVHNMRGEVDAVMVGINTVLKDDPQLTCRAEGGRNPVRVIVDSRLRTPPTANVLDGSARTIIATTSKAPAGRKKALEKKGAEIIVAGNGPAVDLKLLMKQLGSMGITSVMIEGGGSLIGSAFDASIVDKIVFFIAPKVLGGKGVTISGLGAGCMDDALHLEKVEMKKVGKDFMLSGYTK